MVICELILNKNGRYWLLLYFIFPQHNYIRIYTYRDVYITHVCIFAHLNTVLINIIELNNVLLEIDVHLFHKMSIMISLHICSLYHLFTVYFESLHRFTALVYN